MLQDLFYVKQSLGKDGNPIRVYKLMTIDPSNSPPADCSYDVYGHPIDDPGISKLAAFMRRRHLDEFPQIYNIFRGDMKLVGIRPMSEYAWERYPEDLKVEALKHKPGLLGVQYAFPMEGDFDDHVAHLRQYLDERGQSPFMTEMRYAVKILVNELFRGVISS